jgi:uncharacterized membrane protein
MLKDYSSEFAMSDIAENKTLAGLMYVLFFVFFVFMFIKPYSEFIKFHANQVLLFIMLLLPSALVMGIASMILIKFATAYAWIPYVAILGPMAIIWLVQMISAFKGQARKVPFIGEKVFIRWE